MNAITRRTALKSIFGGALALTLMPKTVAALDDGVPVTPLWRLGRNFLGQYFAPALGIAIVKDNRFVYEHAWGFADVKARVECSNSTLFRITSVSKPITAVAIFMLIEQGKLNLNDKVFGPSGVLGNGYSKDGQYKQYVTDVTVDHLLTHTSGGWGDTPSDPMLQHDGWDQQKLIADTIENVPLSSPPGQTWIYSNFGYCVLGRVIEKVSGQPYDQFVKQAVLAPCGITDMQIAGNSYHDRAANEAGYQGQFNENPYKINVKRMDSTAGWIASPNDLAKFAAHLGNQGIPSILKPETIQIMTTPTAVYPQSNSGAYARGWMVGGGNWWHNGSLPGSTATIVRAGNGLCWGALTNTRVLPPSSIETGLNQLVWEMVGQVPRWNS